MHSLVRRYIKTAVAFLVAGLLIGGYLLVRRELRGVLATPYEISAHTHLILVGFVMMMILGVALWLFPRPAKEDTTYSPVAANVAYWLLTIGTAARGVAELAARQPRAPWIAWVIVTSGLAQIAALLVFFYTMWSRIRGVGSQLRERQGERF
jgi:heme/copper-type cytochrome/quinol oxidase subunit 1